MSSKSPMTRPMALRARSDDPLSRTFASGEIAESGALGAFQCNFPMIRRSNLKAIAAPSKGSNKQVTYTYTYVCVYIYI